MKQKTNNMTPDESLAVISEMINNLKEDYKENAYYFILWGWVISLSCILHFIAMVILHRNEMFSIMGFYSLTHWIVFIAAGMIISTIHGRREAKQKPKNRSLYERFINALWLSVGIAMFVVSASCIKFEVYPTVFLMPIIGIATLITGIIIRFKPIIAGGLLFFIAAIISTFWLYEFSLIVNAIAIILGYLIPGYMLKNSNSESHV